MEPTKSINLLSINKNKNMTYARTQNFTSRRRQNWSRNQNTVAYVSSIKLGTVSHTVLVALMIAVLGLIYLTQATRATGYDYDARKIDSQIVALNDQKVDLEIENARLTALETIKNSSVATAMTTPTSTTYVSR
jgi:hypothetical protein